MTQSSPRTPVIGLTGGIGSGKSTAADLLVAKGGALVDTDQIAHLLTAPGGAAIEPIRAAFGDSVIAPDGRMDRTAMRALAFSDPQARKRLEGILHPLIREQTDAQVAAAIAAMCRFPSAPTWPELDSSPCILQNRSARCFTRADPS